MDQIPYTKSYHCLQPDKTEQLHSMLVNCGRELVNSINYYWNGIQRGSKEMFIWQYTIAGCGAFDYAGKTYQITPGKAFAVLVPGKHCYYLPNTSDFWEFKFVTIYGSEAIRLASEFLRRLPIPILDLDANSPTVKSADKIYQLLSETTPNRYECSALAYEFIMALLSENIGSTSNSNMEFFRKQIYDFCLNNISKDIGINEMANAVNLSRWHFTRKFTEIEGISPHDFLLSLRMRLARRLLLTTNLSIKEIAEMCGFKDSAYFSRVFKKANNLTPPEYRFCKK